MCGSLFCVCKSFGVFSVCIKNLHQRRPERCLEVFSAVCAHLAVLTFNPFYMKPWSVWIPPSIQVTHINEGGKYVGPKHHQKHLCQQGAEVVLIKMYQEGTGCTPDESQTILILIKMFLPGISQHRN